MVFPGKTQFIKLWFIGKKYVVGKIHHLFLITPNLWKKNCLSENLYKNTALLIHDAARCFTQPELIENLIKVFYEKLGYNMNILIQNLNAIKKKKVWGKKLDCEQYKTVSQR